jgi:hypothetical protein
MTLFTDLAKRFIMPAVTKRGERRFAFDTESDGFLDNATKVHCVVIKDLDSGRVDAYSPEQIADALKKLASADYLIGHNAQGHDLPLLQHLCGWAPSPGCLVDTLVASRTILPNISDLDDQSEGMGDPALGKLRGSHSLEAWGTRLGIPKVGADITDWSTWTPEMQARCVADVEITAAVWHLLQPDGYSQPALELEHRAAEVCARITADGVPFDEDAAVELHEKWQAQRSELEAQLGRQFPGTKLSSRVQIGALLEARGWRPEKRTEKTGRPKIEDELLETMSDTYPEFSGIAAHFVLGRRLAQLSSGKQAWRKKVGRDGRIHGGLVHIGTPHSRAKHLAPNLAQVPSPKKGKPLRKNAASYFGQATIGCLSPAIRRVCRTAVTRITCTPLMMETTPRRF